MRSVPPPGTGQPYLLVRTSPSAYDTSLRRFQRRPVATRLLPQLFAFSEGFVVYTTYRSVYMTRCCLCVSFPFHGDIFPGVGLLDTGVLFFINLSLGVGLGTSRVAAAVLQIHPHLPTVTGMLAP